MPLKDPVARQQYAKKYYLENREKILEEAKTYKTENLEKVLAARERDRDKNNARKQMRVKCECGCEVARNHLSEHRKTKKHIKLMEAKKNICIVCIDEDVAPSSIAKG